MSLDTGEIEFSPDVLTYEIEVLNDVTTIDITATLEDSKATVTGDGSFELETGSNTFKITVKAEDGTTKDYQITVLREEPIEDIEDSSLEESFQEPLKNNTKTLVLILSIVFILLLILASSLIIYRKHLKKTKQD